MKKLGVLLAALVLAAGMSYAAFAESANVNVTVNALPKLEITVSTPQVNFGSLEPETPKTISNAVSVTVKSNRPFTYSYTATDFVSGGDSYSIGILKWANAGSGNFTSFANSGTFETWPNRGTKTYT
ncbi:MAG: hypothetical protein N2440_02785, partial [Actinobacteria bacterium]|nr:hypothetical protein [Actinomycetota bacterium]